MSNNATILYSAAGALFLILSIFSAPLLSLSCSISRTKGPSFLRGVGISILLVALFLGAIVGGPFAVREVDEHVKLDQKLDVLKQNDLHWLDSKDVSPIRSMKQSAIFIGLALPVLMFVGAIFLKMSLSGTSFGQALQIYFVYLVLFLVLFAGVFYGAVYAWQNFVLTS